jgi:transmembrane 9 superfamily protein 2/4
MNKLKSTKTLSSMDYAHRPWCNNREDVTPLSAESAWKGNMDVWHGDAWYRGPILGLEFLADQYCAVQCDFSLEQPSEQEEWESAIARGFHYHVSVDGLPVAHQWEDDDTVHVLSSGGVPLGRRGGPGESANPQFDNETVENLFVYNHWNLRIDYVEKGPGEYQIVHAVIQPFSVQPVDGTDGARPAMESCTTERRHTNYDMTTTIPPQSPSGSFPFTVDVIWVKAPTDIRASSRWNQLLTMDDFDPLMHDVSLQIACLVLALFINAILYGSLWTWVMRDLSYKPVAMETEIISEEQEQEMQLWPLSTRVFFPVTRHPWLFCAACGQGAHLLLTTLCFLFFFQIGVIHQALGATILLPVVALYTIASPMGGYVTGRCRRVLHGRMMQALKACVSASTLYPLLGLLVMVLCYDVFPSDEAPRYRVLDSSKELILLWLLGIVPLTLLGGFLGYRNGPIDKFPVSEGTMGYQDLALHRVDDSDDSSKRSLCWLRMRTPVLFLTAGLLPMLSFFNTYAYGVAAPVYQDFYVSSRLQVFLPFILFLTCVGGVAMLLFYRQIRAQNYAWWWATFLTAGSSGFYCFLLSISWLIYNATHRNADARSVAVYMLWFAYTSLGVTLACGFVGILSCVLFSRALYSYGLCRAP